MATKFKEKLLAVNSDHQIHRVHCIIHRELLCTKTLKMDHVMDVAIKAMNLICARDLNHRQLVQQLIGGNSHSWADSAMSH